jgi:hypothetical protein
VTYYTNAAHTTTAFALAVATAHQEPCPVFELTWSPITHAFGTTAGTQTFTLTNTGNQPVWLEGFSSTAPDTSILSFNLQQLGFCDAAHDTSYPEATPLGVGESCTVDATFTGVEECGTGTYSAGASFSYFTNDAQTTTATAPVGASGHQ